MNYIVKEMVISSIINALFSIAFCFLSFWTAQEISLGGTSALTIDFLPQAFFVGLFAALPSSLLTAKRLKEGNISPLQIKRLPLPKRLHVRIVLFALGSLLIFGGGAVLILSQLPTTTISFNIALVIKAVYGILITIVITPMAVCYLISNG